jgi:hypothetical protein
LTCVCLIDPFETVATGSNRVSQLALSANFQLGNLNSRITA